MTLQKDVTTRFGAAALELWPLDPGLLYLNHGTVGVTPKRVLAAQQAIRDETEREPARFLLRELSSGQSPRRKDPPRLRSAAAVVAEFVRSRPEDLVFVDNATTGANAVLQSFPFAAGDEVLVTNLNYGAVTNAARFSTGRVGGSVRVAQMPHPVRDPESIVKALDAAIGPKTRMLLVDHITSESALVMPIREIARRCHPKGVAVLVDGAHAPGQLDLDVPSLGVDWYTANLHKWACAPRSSGFLWASEERQRGLHPAIISWGYEKGYLVEFEWGGTRDLSTHLAAPAGIEFMRELGIDDMRRYQHQLAMETGRILTRRWGTVLETPESMIGSMITVPMPASLGTTRDDAQRIRDALLFEDRIEVQMHSFQDQLWARISAQVYVDVAGIERLAEAVAKRA
jgi:isopenicillin-N epimerase